MRPIFILALDYEGESNSKGEFCVKKRLIIVFSKISRAIYNCEGGDFQRKARTLVTCSKIKDAPFVGAFVFGIDRILTRVLLPI
jgi:hypothetical protein